LVLASPRFSASEVTLAVFVSIAALDLFELFDERLFLTLAVVRHSDLMSVDDVGEFIRALGLEVIEVFDFLGYRVLEWPMVRRETLDTFQVVNDAAANAVLVNENV
jgi:hypothetical protein